MTSDVKIDADAVAHGIENSARNAQNGSVALPEIAADLDKKPVIDGVSISNEEASKMEAVVDEKPNVGSLDDATTLLADDEPVVFAAPSTSSAVTMQRKTYASKRRIKDSPMQPSSRGIFYRDSARSKPDDAAPEVKTEDALLLRPSSVSNGDRSPSSPKRPRVDDEGASFLGPDCAHVNAVDAQNGIGQPDSATGPLNGVVSSTVSPADEGSLLTFDFSSSILNVPVAPSTFKPG